MEFRSSTTDLPKLQGERTLMASMTIKGVGVGNSMAWNLRRRHWQRFMRTSSCFKGETFMHRLSAGEIYAHPQAGNCALESCICMNKMSNCMCRLLLVREITCFASVNCCSCMHIYLFAVFIFCRFELAVCV